MIERRIRVGIEREGRTKFSILRKGWWEEERKVESCIKVEWGKEEAELWCMRCTAMNTWYVHTFLLLFLVNRFLFHVYEVYICIYMYMEMIVRGKYKSWYFDHHQVLLFLPLLIDHISVHICRLLSTVVKAYSYVLTHPFFLFFPWKFNPYFLFCIVFVYISWVERSSLPFF